MEAPQPFEMIIPEADPLLKPTPAKKITPRKKQLATKVKKSPAKGN
jgi:hypothetical protein